MRGSAIVDATPQANGPHSHFWFMTLQATTQNGYVVSSHSGECTPHPGQTRLDVFTALRDLVRETSPDLSEAVVLAFDLQPNQL